MQIALQLFFLHEREKPYLSDYFVEGVTQVLLQDDPHSHVDLGPKEYDCLGRAREHFVDFNSVFEEQDLGFSLLGVLSLHAVFWVFVFVEFHASLTYD